MTFGNNINCIQETAPGRYCIILDFATTKILPFLIRPEYHYTWVHHHKPGKGFDWEECSLSIKDASINISTLARSLTFDFILPTEDFKKIMQDWKGGIELIQMNKIPPYYLDLDKVKGNKRYKILQQECDYLFEVNIPSATDYGTLISSNKEYLESLLGNPAINWHDLP